MADFSGKYDGKLDDKGRLVLPVAFRNKGVPNGGSLIVHKNIFEKSLDLYTQDEWQKFSGEVLAGINIHSREGNRTWIAFNRHRNETDVDAKTGRIMIAKNLLELVKIDKDVCFFGNGNKISVWAKEEWEKLNSEIDDEKVAADYERIMTKQHNR